MSKDEGLIAAEADFLNTQLRMYYGDQHQVVPGDDWRDAIQHLVYGVLYQARYEKKMKNSRKEEEKPPCDCIKSLDGNWMVDSCYCGNQGDLIRAASWCSSMNEKGEL